MSCNGRVMSKQMSELEFPPFSFYGPQACVFCLAPVVPRFSYLTAAQAGCYGLCSVVVANLLPPHLDGCLTGSTHRSVSHYNRFDRMIQSSNFLLLTSYKNLQPSRPQNGSVLTVLTVLTHFCLTEQQEAPCSCLEGK